MKTYAHVEDYLEVIAGKRSVDGTPLSTGFSLFGFSEFKPIVSLARYDVSFLDSVTDATLGSTSLTDRQAELAVRIISKYNRQLHAHNISVDGIVETPVYRKPIRVIDRSKYAEVCDGEILVRFPYDQKLIEYIRDNAKDSQGRIRFDRDLKAWRAALTEYNVNWVVALAETYEFVLDQTIRDSMQMILDSESLKYSIQLELEQDHLTIANAPAPLLEYLGNSNNQFPLSDIAVLADASTVLGYTIHHDVEQRYTDALGTEVAIMLQHREYDFKSANWENLEQKIYSYAQLVDRFPIVVFDPQCNFKEWEQVVDKEHILNLVPLRSADDLQVCKNTTAQVILTNRAIKYMDSIPLLVSHMGMIVGQDKRIMTDASEKVFYRNGKLA